MEYPVQPKTTMDSFKGIPRFIPSFLAEHQQVVSAKIFFAQEAC